MTKEVGGWGGMSTTRGKGSADGWGGGSKEPPKTPTVEKEPDPKKPVEKTGPHNSDLKE